MKCEACVAKGMKSMVLSRWQSTTLVGGTEYFDEDGRRHVHDPNVTTAKYECSNGHMFTRKTKHGCAVCDADGVEIWAEGSGFE